MPEETWRKENPRSPRVELQAGSAPPEVDVKNTTLPRCLYILLHRHSATFTPALTIIAGKWKQPTFPQRWKTGRKAAPVDLGVFLVSTKGSYRKDSRKFMLSKAGTGPARQVQSALAWREGPLSYISASLFKGIVFPAILRYLFRYIMFPFPVWLPAVPFKMLHGIFFSYCRRSLTLPGQGKLRAVFV